ncbi:hypothetical protein [Gluconobacter oxydans]|uniref:hypothetical protein n=1 Tax=Gluconobacter oxydans TaxID=442 RepID=UPI0039ED5157
MMKSRKFLEPGYAPLDQLYDATVVLQGVVLPVLRDVISSPGAALNDARLEGALVVITHLAADLNQVFAENLDLAGSATDSTHSEGSHRFSVGEGVA